MAYGFIAQERLPLWDLWSAYFASCAPGSALPIVHSQDLRPASRRRLAAQIAPFGGALVRVNETVRGDPRFSWRMMRIQFALTRVAVRTRTLSGCAPRWLHLASDRDAPATRCTAPHQSLAFHPRTSRLGIFRLDGGPYYGFGKEYDPVGHTHQWTTLAMEHAAALADDEAVLYTKWHEAIAMARGDAVWSGVTPTNADGGDAWVGFHRSAPGQ